MAEHKMKGKQIGDNRQIVKRRIWEKDDIKRKATEVIIDQFQLERH